MDKPKSKKLLMALIRRAIINNITVPENLKSLIVGTFTYTLDMSHCRWEVLMSDINKLFPHLPKSGETYTTALSKFYNEDNTQNDDAMFVMNGQFIDWCVYRGSIIILHYNIISKKDDRTEHQMFFRCLNTKRDVANLHHMLKRLVERHDVYQENENKKYINVIGRNFTSEIKPNRRGMNTVFIPSDVKTQILDSISKFINNKQWYQDHSIPYHFGILLYGPPGTGKSSIVKALTEEFNCNSYYIKQEEFARAFADNTGGFLSAISSSTRPSFIIAEDIDKITFLNAKYNMRAKKKHCGDDEVEDIYDGVASTFLGSFLNIMDGMNSPKNAIWVFSTNYIDDLEPALIRPGRIDLKIEIGYITNETFNEFMLHHFNKPLPEGYNVADKHTFAEIQTDVMTGKTYDAIINKYRKEN